MGLSPQLFAMLKNANPARFEILQDLMKRLGLDCQTKENLSLTPCFLYSTKQVHCERVFLSNQLLHIHVRVHWTFLHLFILNIYRYLVSPLKVVEGI